MSRMDNYTKFLTEGFGKPTVMLNEMAGKGKPGPMSAAEKAAKASSDAEAAAAKHAQAEKNAADHKDYTDNYAPKHNKNFIEHAHKELTHMGFNKVHDGPKKAIYTAMKPGTESLHTVEIKKPTGDPSTYHAHSVSIRHTNSGGTSYGGKSHYQPSIMHHLRKREGQEGSEAHERSEHEKVTADIRHNFTKEDSWHDQ